MDFHLPQAILEDTLILGSEPSNCIINYCRGFERNLAIIDVEADRCLVRIFLQGYPYAVTQHLLTRRNFLFLNSLKDFQRSLAEISQFQQSQLFHFVDNSNHLKDLVIFILWTLVIFFSNAQAMILTVLLRVYQTQ